MSEESIRYPRLELIFDKFARIASRDLSDLLFLRMELNPISLETGRFGAFMRSVPVPSWTSTFRAAPWNAPLVSITDARVAFPVISRVFGGRAQSLIEGREFTSIEKIILAETDHALALDIEDAFATLFADIQVIHAGSVQQPQFASLFPADLSCFRMVFEVETDTAIGAMSLIVPFHPFREYLFPLQDTASGYRIITGGLERCFEVAERRDSRRKAFERGCRSSPNRKFFQSLASADPERAGYILRDEHPQTLACLFAYLPPDAAARLVLTLPWGVRSDVLSRMDNLSPGAFHLYEKIDGWLEDTLPAFTPGFPSAPKDRIMSAISRISEKQAELVRQEFEDQRKP